MITHFTKPLAKLFGGTACLALLTSVALTQPALAQNGPTLKIEHFIGTIDIQTGDYNKITITDADGVSVDKSGSNVTLDDDKNMQNYNCRYRRDTAYIGKGKSKWSWTRAKSNYKNINEFPSVKITAPRDTHLVIEKSIIFGDVETVGSAEIHIRSCGDLNLGDVNGELVLHVSGAGDVHMGNAGVSDIHVSGAGDLIGGNLASADIHVSGSADLELGDVAGHVKIHSSGASDVELGNISGGMEFDGSGSSDFEARSVSGGDLSVRVSGSSDVTISGGEVETLYVRASGASDVIYRGKSVDADARASGASDVTIRMPSGELDMSDSGAGDVHITN
ncbi:MAG: hypothetical protein COA69_02595 [Robiginitomaculum sp.]|nr:MAG: hypothetical protein COA69_02595 [Robiginitomaculum sp.]